MKVQKSEEEVEREIRNSMQIRGIVDVKAFLIWLRGQKVTKREASKARVVEAELEISVIDRMREAIANG